MKYLCLAYEEACKLHELTQAQWQQLRRESLDYVADLQRRHKLVLTHALQSTRTAHRIEVREP